MSLYLKESVRASAVLTGSYVAGTVVELNPNVNQAMVLVNFTKGSLDSLEVKVEFSPDNSTFFQESYEASASSTSNISTVVIEPKVYQMAATGKLRIPIPIKDRYVKISVKGTGTVDNSACAVDIVSDKV